MFFRDGKFKGITFIDYDSEKAASNAVLTMNNFVLRDFTVNYSFQIFVFRLQKTIHLLQIAVAISNPPPKSDTPRPFNAKPSSLPGMRAPPPRRYVLTSYRNILLPLDTKTRLFLHFHSDAKPRLSFIPTSVQRNVPKPSPPADGSNETNGGTASTSKSNDYFRQLMNKK